MMRGAPLIVALQEAMPIGFCPKRTQKFRQ
jgi:hypothetical protein